MQRSERARPPDDISPVDFFTRWIPEAVASDDARRARLGDTEASIEFSLDGPEGGVFAIYVEHGIVRGAAGPPEQADVHVHLDVATWRMLNRGEISAPEAILKRRLKVSGNFLLGLKLHLILG